MADTAPADNPSRPAPGLADFVDRLAGFYGDPVPPPSADPFELVLLENVAYLAPDDRRSAAFDHLRQHVGTTPEAILNATPESLQAATSRGILKGASAAKLRRCAQIAMELFGGDLAKSLPEPDREAKAALRRFPGIGEPGSEKILLFARGRPFLAPDSNALRVLVRLGLIEEGRSYTSTYRRARSVASTLGSEPTALQRAHLLLRMHGKATCRNRRPLCSECPLEADCAFAQGRPLAR